MRLLAFDITQPKNAGIAYSDYRNGNVFVNDLVKFVAEIFFIVGGTGVIIMFLWGAVDWILSGGDKEKIAGARKKMTNAIIGLALLSFSYLIINIVGGLVGFNPLDDTVLPAFGGITRFSAPQPAIVKP